VLVVVATVAPRCFASWIAIDPGQVVAQNERQAIGQNEFELAVLDLQVERLDAGGVDLDQDVIVAQLRVGHFTSPHTIAAPITIDDECLHGSRDPDRTCELLQTGVCE